MSTISAEGASHRKVEAYTKPECIYNITQELLGGGGGGSGSAVVPTYMNFIKWYCFPVNHQEVAAMTAVHEHCLELLPLQNYLDRQLFSNRVDIALEVFFSVDILLFTTTSLVMIMIIVNIIINLACYWSRTDLLTDCMTAIRCNLSILNNVFILDAKTSDNSHALFHLTLVIITNSTCNLKSVNFSENNFRKRANHNVSNIHYDQDNNKKNACFF